jgi:hypothetical protein
MFKLVAFALAVVSTVSGAAIFPRQNPPNGWDCDVLESYDDYHTRYLALSCQNQHNSQFFDDCCHPLKKGETLENDRKPYCTPGADPSSTLSELPSNTLITEPSSSPAPEPTSVPDSGDDCEDDDDEISDDDGDEDCDDDTPSTSPAYDPSSTPPSVPTPYTTDPTPTPTPTPTPEPSPSSTDQPAPSPSPDSNTSGSETHTGGDLTWFTQNGVPGACGTVHDDSDFIAALDYRAYGDTSSQSPYCGKKIRISWQDKSVDVIVADACPTCDNASSVDLSLAAFQALAPLDTGVLSGASWTLL